MNIPHIVGAGKMLGWEERNFSVKTIELLKDLVMVDHLLDGISNSLFCEIVHLEEFSIPVILPHQCLYPSHMKF